MNKSTVPVNQCIACKLLIPKEANLCTHCDSYQDWRRFIPVSHTTLALLIALVTSFSSATIALYNTFHTPTSNAFISSIDIVGTTLRVAVVNNGDAAAFISKIYITNRYLAPATRVRFRDDAEAIIPAGSKIIILDIVPLLDEDTSYKISLKALEYQILGVDPEAQLGFRITQSDGGFAEQSRVLTIDEFHDIFRSNADRCSAIEHPNYDNGCIGNGMTSEEFMSEDSDSAKEAP